MRSEKTPVSCVLIGLAMYLLAGTAVAQDSDFVGAFKEMMPDVAYTADRETTMSIGSVEQEMTSKIVYTPYKEWSSTRVQGKGSTEMVTITDYANGKMVTSVMGMNTASEIAPMQSLKDGNNGASIEFVGEANMNGVDVKAYNFKLMQTQGGTTYKTNGRVLLDNNGIPQVVFWTIESDKSDTIHMRQQLSNVVVGSVDESLFAALNSPASDGPNNAMATLMNAAGASPTSAPVTPADLQKQSISARLSGWTGGQGRLIDDNGTVLGTVDDTGNLAIVVSAPPKGGIYPIASGYSCDGVSLSDPSAGSSIIESFTVVDATSNPLGVVYAANSMNTLEWWANPGMSSAPKGGFKLRFVYVDRPVQSVGYCAGGSETQERNLEFQAGWNIEKFSIDAVGNSPFFETEQPTMTRWETVDSVPANTTWIYADMTVGQREQRRKAGNMPDPVQEVMDTATDTATEMAKEKVDEKVKEGLRKLFGN